MLPISSCVFHFNLYLWISSCCLFGSLYLVIVAHFILYLWINSTCICGSFHSAFMACALHIASAAFFIKYLLFILFCILCLIILIFNDTFLLSLGKTNVGFGEHLFCNAAYSILYLLITSYLICVSFHLVVVDPFIWYLWLISSCNYCSLHLVLVGEF